jgi:hypothetical protein
MAIALRLNRRHKAALFVTLVLAGASLVSGDAMKIGLGIILLGVAFTWAFGSDSRVVHRLFLACGLLIVIGSLMYDWWHDNFEDVRLYRDEVTAFELRFPELAESHPLLPYDVKCKDLRVTPLCPPGWVEVKQPDGSYRMYEENNVPDGSPPAGLRLTRDQLAQAIRNKEPVYHTSDNEKLVTQFLDMYPQWRTALVEDGASGDSQPKWYADAVAAGVNITAVPKEEKPAPPEPFRLWQSVGNERVIIMPGVILFFTGVGLLFGVKPNRNEG